MKGNVLLTTGAAALLGAAVLVAAGPAAGAAPRPIGDDHLTTGGFRPAAVDWQPCPERPADTTVRCATIRLPIDWSHPDGPDFGLAIDEQSAGDPAADEGPLVVNPGGPGSSGVDFVLNAKSYFSAALLRHFDVVGFDPRGTNRSDPVTCPAALVDAKPFPVPGSRAGYLRLLAYNARLTAGCRAASGPIFDHVDTISVARDMDAIRAALGAPALSYYGLSYGTLFGQDYAELFPSRVRAMALDSNVDNSLGSLPYLLTEAATDEDSFDQFVAWCDRDTSCALHGRDVPAIFTGRLRRADAGMLTDTATGRKTTWFALVETTVTVMEAPSWPELADGIAQLEATGSTALSSAPATPPVLSCENSSFTVSGYQQMRRYLAATDAVAPELRTPALDWNRFADCLGWTGPAPDPQHPLRVHTRVPLLLLNSLHDPRTAYAGALDDAAQLGASARLVTYLGSGHVAYPRTPCTTDTVDDYLINLTLPTPHTTCPAAPGQPTPFLATTASATR